MNCPHCDSDNTKHHPREEGGDWDEVFAAYNECLDCEAQWGDDDPGAFIDASYEAVRDREMMG